MMTSFHLGTREEILTASGTKRCFDASKYKINTLPEILRDLLKKKKKLNRARKFEDYRMSMRTRGKQTS